MAAAIIKSLNGNTFPFAAYLLLDLPHKPSRLFHDDIDRNQTDQFFDEQTAGLRGHCRPCPCTNSATVTGDKDRSSGPCARRMLSTKSGTDCFRRSAEIAVLESSTNPTRADAMAVGGWL